jgi:hypothetical protein
MPKCDRAAPGGPPGAGASSTQSWLVNGAHPTAERAHRQQARCIHELGPRALGELLREIERDPTDGRRIVEKYAELNPAFVAAAGGRDWLEPRDLVRRVGP